jgi:3-phenylpropionate/trans-cinnamate dioxygenase ferredoxin component
MILSDSNINLEEASSMFNYAKYDESKADFHEVGPAKLQSGERLYVENGGKMILVFNIADQYYAIDDICTHDGWSLEEGELYDHTIVCPRHDGKYDVRTGKVTGSPPEVDIASYPVRIEKGKIFVGFPKN